MKIKTAMWQGAAVLGLIGTVFGLIGCGAPTKVDEAKQVGQLEQWPSMSSPVAISADIESSINDLLARMTLEQKVGQMIQAEIRSVTPEEITQYHLGSVLNGGGAFPNNEKHSSVADWLALADKFYMASMVDAPGRVPVPILWGTDAVHGHNNVIGATIFPHNIGLGAANNPALAKKIAQATATEVAATGIDWTFAPTLAVVQDVRWGRTYEGYAQTPERVNALASAMVTGLQGEVDDLLAPGRVLATAKHFIADGGTHRGDDQGNTIIAEKDLIETHAPPYFSALDAGAQTVMISYSSINGKKMHGHKYLITDVLKGRLGFDGFVISDWNGIGQVKGCANNNCAAAVNAGIDMLMVPNNTDWKDIISNILEQVNAGVIAEARIDDSVRRILRVKMRAGLFERGKPSARKYAGDASLVGAKAHRDIARQAVSESLVLLKNNNATLPLLPNKKILVVGSGANNLPMQTGGWSISWQGEGNVNADFPGGTTVFDGIKSAVSKAGGSVDLVETVDALGKASDYDVAVVVVGDEPYAEFKGDIQNDDTLVFQEKTKEGLKLVKALKEKNIPVVTVMLTGRPQWTNAEINASDAFVVAWLPGSEGAGVADVLIAKPDGSVNKDFTGTLSFEWPASACAAVIGESKPLFGLGYGLTFLEKSNMASVNSIENTAQLGCAKPSVAKQDWAFVPALADVSYSHNSELYESVPMGEAKSFAGVTLARAESAYSVSWDGTAEAKVAFGFGLPKNMLQDLVDNQFLTVDFSSLVLSSGEIKLGMECGMPCSADIEISSALKEVAASQSKRLQVDLRCFSERAIDFEKISTPLTIKTRNKLSVSVGRVSLEPAMDSAYRHSCSK